MSDALISATVEEPQYDDHDWTRVDRQIIDAFGKKSIRQLSEETGVSQSDLMRRKQELVDSVDVLTIQMQRMKLMSTLQEIADRALEDAKNADSEFRAGLLNSSVAAAKELLKQLDRLESKGTAGVDALNQLRIREIVSLMNRVVTSGVDEFSAQNGLDRDEMMETFTSRLVIEASKMDK